MIFIDSGVFIGASISSDLWHERAKMYLEKYNDIEKIILSDFVLQEAITIIGSLLGGKAALKVYKTLINSENVRIVFVDRDMLDKAMEYHLKYDGTLSLSDVISIVIMQDLEIKDLISFDSDFDKVKGIRRIG